MVSRSSLIVKYNNKKALIELEKNYNVTYNSKKMKYVIVYCNKSEINTLRNSLSSIKGVVSVEESKVDMSIYDFEE